MTELRLISHLARSLGLQTYFVALASSQLHQSGIVEKKMGVGVAGVDVCVDLGVVWGVGVGVMFGVWPRSICH